MKTTVLAVATVLTLLAAASASPVSAQGPVASVRDSVFDAGVVAKGEAIEHRFEIQNQGDRLLELEQVKPSCGCQVTRFAKRIQAGGFGRVTVTMTTDDFTGPIAKSVAVFTNDPNNPRIDLVIKAVIQPRVEVRPGYARFVAIQGDGYEPSEQTVSSAQVENFEIVRVESPYPHLEAAFDRKLGDDGEPSSRGEWIVRLSLAENAPLGAMSGFVRVHTNHPDQKVIRIPVSGYLRPAVAVRPIVVDFGQQRLEEPLPATIEVHILTSESVRLGEVSIDLEGVSTEVEEVKPGRLYHVVIQLGPEMAKGETNGTLTVETTSRLMPTLEIPVTGTVL